MASDKEVLKLLRCPSCGGGDFNSKLTCKKCGYKIKKKNNVYIFDEFLNQDMVEENKVNKEDIEKHGYNDLEKFLSKIKGSRKEFLANEIIERLKKEGKLSNQTKILEIGGGAGWLTFRLKKETEFAYNTDISYDYLNLLNSPTFLVSMQNIDKIFKQNCFDILWANASIHHSPNLDSVFAAAKNVLKKEGVFIVTSELIVGRLITNDEVEESQEKGLQDTPYRLSDYVKSAKKYFNVKLEVPPDLSYYANNSEEIRSGWKRKIFQLFKKIGIHKLVKYAPLKQLYFLFAELFGTQVLLLCEKK